MTAALSHSERFAAALDGKAVDRVPVSMWRHFFPAESSTEGLAEAMLAYQSKYDWDFMKLNPRASYHGEGWGLKTVYSGDSAPTIAAYPVNQPTDWGKIDALDHNEGMLGEHLRALEMVSKELEGSVPILMTVFNPISVASRLVGSEELFVSHLRQHWDLVRPALEAIADTFARFSAACVNRGACGLFFATTAWATSSKLSLDEYGRYARPYDLKVLAAVACGSNMLHVCRDHNMLGALADYPVQAVNWDCWGGGNPSLAQGKRLLGNKAVVGGVPHKGLREMSVEDVRCALDKVKDSMSGQPWILSSGCTYPPDTPETLVRAVRQWAEEG